jgi:hypothetical protein
MTESKEIYAEGLYSLDFLARAYGWDYSEMLRFCMLNNIPVWRGPNGKYVIQPYWLLALYGQPRYNSFN